MCHDGAPPRGEAIAPVSAESTISVSAEGEIPAREERADAGVARAVGDHLRRAMRAPSQAGMPWRWGDPNHRYFFFLEKLRFLDLLTTRRFFDRLSAVFLFL